MADLEDSVRKYLEIIIFHLEMKQIAESITRVWSKRPSTGLRTLPEYYIPR